MEIFFLLLSYLGFSDLKAFSCANSACNTIAAPLLYRHYTISWTERQPLSDLILNINALELREDRARSVRTLTITCGWKWTPDLEDKFGHILDIMPRLSFLYVDVPADWEGHIFGSELSPLARLLYNRRSRMDLQEFQWNHYILPTSPIIPFLESQSNLTYLHAPRVHHTTLIRRPITFSHPFLNLETLTATESHIAELFVPNSPKLDFLRMFRDGAYIPFVLPDGPAAWMSQTVSTLSFRPLESSDPEWADELASVFPNLQTILFHDDVVPAVGDLNVFGQLRSIFVEGFEDEAPQSVLYDLARYPPSFKELSSRTPPSRWIRDEGNDSL